MFGFHKKSSQNQDKGPERWTKEKTPKKKYIHTGEQR